MLVLAAYLLVLPYIPTTQTWARSLVCFSSLLLGLRYLYWRLSETVLPTTISDGAEFYWIWFVFVAECAIYLEVIVFYLIMSRYKTRHSEADSNEQRWNTKPASKKPLVDIFIPTYNEPIEVLEKTIIGAANLDYPNVRVFVLDDGKRDWLRQFCKQENVEYITRDNNQHAKAGNMNNGLKYASGDFVCIFDADFVPHRNFIKRTIGFFDDPTIGIVQTPQHFFNKDPVQTNLGIDKEWPDEQRLFFDKMAECRDAWDVAFCCGSCSIVRRSALDDIGGFPTESITEDLLTTLKMQRKGYKTRYLNEQLSMGLAAESLEAFFIQRARWCQGGIQSIFLKEGPLGPDNTWLQRLMFFPWSWIIQYPTRFIVLMIPIVYLWTGMTPLKYTSFDDIMFYQIPMFVGYFIAMKWLAPNHYLPVLSSVQNLFSTFRLLPTVITSIFKPFGKPFLVTPKGSLNSKVSFDQTTFAAVSLVIIGTLAGCIINLYPETSILKQEEFFPVALYWSAYNIICLCICALMCFDAVRHRTEERFSCSEDVTVNGDASVVSTMLDLSVGGCRINICDVNNIQTVEIKGVGVVCAKEVNRFPYKDPQFIALEFETTASTRRKLIRKLFAGDYNNAVSHISYDSILRRLFVRAFGKSI